MNRNNNFYSDEEWSALIEPIASERPTGTDTRNDISPVSLYQRIRDARSLARNNERTNLAAGESLYFSMAEWLSIKELVPELLKSQSKDLECVAWYIEALCRTDGFSGVAAGFSLASKLIEKYGDLLYPLADEDGISTQLSALSGLNGFGGEGTLIGPIKSIPLTQAVGIGPLATWQCEQAYEIDRIKDTDRRLSRLKQGGLSKDEMLKVVAESGTAFLQKTMAEIIDAISCYDSYQKVLDAYAHSDLQPSGKIKETLESCRLMLTYLAGDRIQSENDVLELNTMAELDDTEGMASEAVSSGIASINGRVQAIRQLKEVADYFRKTEPHSPMSYSIEQVIRWSQLPLTELIRELIPDEGARVRFQSLSGIEAD